MNITITRGRSSPNGTPGVLVADGGFSCDTLELPWRNNRRGVSCIMPGVYRAKVWYSPTFKCDVVRLEDRNGRRDCLIHSGNLAGDVEMGKVTQVHGCTEVGRGFGGIPVAGGMQHGILNSKAALRDLVAHLGDGMHRVTYQWSDGCVPDDADNVVFA